MKYYRYNNNNIKLNNNEINCSGEKLLEDIFFVDIFIVLDKIIIIRGIYEK